MKGIRFWTYFILGLGPLAWSLPSGAQGREVIQLKTGNHYAITKACSAKPFKGLRVHWRGLIDGRPEKALGVVMKKSGKDPVEVYADPPLRDFFVGYLKDTLHRCGMELLPKADPNLYSLTVTLEKFRAHEEKGLITGEGEAQSSLKFEAERGKKKVTSQVGYKIEFKQGRKRGVKRLNKVLNELFQETLLQVVSSPQFQNLREDSS